MIVAVATPDGSVKGPKLMLEIAVGRGGKIIAFQSFTGYIDNWN